MIQINLQILNGRDRTLHFLLYHHYYYFLSLSRSFLVLSVKFEKINWRWLPVYYTSCPLGWPWITFTGSHLVLPLYCFHLKCKSNSPHGTAAQPFSARVCCNFFVIYVWDWPIMHCSKKFQHTLIIWPWKLWPASVTCFFPLPIDKEVSVRYEQHCGIYNLIAKELTNSTIFSHIHAREFHSCLFVVRFKLFYQVKSKILWKFDGGFSEYDLSESYFCQLVKYKGETRFILLHTQAIQGY